MIARAGGTLTTGPPRSLPGAPAASVARDYSATLTLANEYAGSRTITCNSSQHVTYMQTPSSCVNDPVTRYVLTRTLPRDITFCGFVPSPHP